MLTNKTGDHLTNNNNNNNNNNLNIFIQDCCISFKKSCYQGMSCHLHAKKLKCICNVHVKLASKSRLKSIPFGLNKVDPVIVLLSH